MPDTLPVLTVRKSLTVEASVAHSPSRVVLSWHLNGEWQYDPDPSHASEVECGSFRMARPHEGGWNGLLARFAAKVKETAA